MTLKQYNKKRDFRSSPEPKAASSTSTRKRNGKAGALQFVVQKHAASNLHYDFRLELDGVLLSWAVPKGPSLDPANKRLAVRVEDHPLAYAAFEGTIPKGAYGGGEVIVWDRGSWLPQGDPRAGLEKGELKLELRGEKLKGGWVLVQMKGRGEKNWLLIKEKDDEVDRENDILVTHPESVLSGQAIEALREAPAPEWEPGEQPAQKKRRSAPASGGASGAKKARFPASISPQLATLVETPPAGDAWIFEIKYDGYRILSFIRDGKVVLRTRNGHAWTKKYPGVAKAFAALPCENAVLDGELVALDSQGRMDFQALQNATKGRGKNRLIYYAFDVIHLNGRDLTKVSLRDRKPLLEDLISAADPEVIRYSDHFMGDGETAFEHACKHGLEGLIAKRADSAYVQKRSRDWLKIKCTHRQEFVVGGFTAPQGSRKQFGALLLGYYDGGKLVYCGRAGTGFDAATLASVHSVLRSRRRKTPPFDAPPTRIEGKGAQWVTPDQVAEVAFAGWTDEGRVRAASFQGLRADREAASVRREAAQPPPKPAVAKKATRQNGKGAVAGVALTHPKRVLYPEQGLTKEAVAEYYAEIATRLLPFVAGRPLSILRCPEGRKKSCFYQKHRTDGLPAAVQGVSVSEEDDTRDYITIDDAAGLVSLVQMGTIEVHPWGSRNDRLDRPDTIVFDLDPDSGVAWADVVAGARRLHDTLDALGLETFLKTSAGKGLHVVAPITRRNSWDEVKGFAKAVAVRLAREFPKDFVATASKARRKNRIYIDYLRNSRGSTAIAPYALRARAGAPIATPVGWDELSPALTSDKYTVENIRRRLAQLQSDPWANYSSIRQSITQAMVAAID